MSNLFDPLELYPEATDESKNVSIVGIGLLVTKGFSFTLKAHTGILLAFQTHFYLLSFEGEAMSSIEAPTGCFGWLMIAF